VVNPLWRSQFPFYFLHFTFYIRVGCQRLFNFLGFDRWSLNNAAQWEPKEVIISIDKSPLTSLSLCPSSTFSAPRAKRLFNNFRVKKDIEAQSEPNKEKSVIIQSLYAFSFSLFALSLCSLRL